MESITIGDAKARFSEFVSRAAAGERFLISRRERPIAVLVGYEDLERMERARELGLQLALALGQSPEVIERIERGEIHAAMAAFGLWKDEPDLEGLEEEISANRRRQGSRPGVQL